MCNIYLLFLHKSTKKHKITEYISFVVLLFQYSICSAAMARTLTCIRCRYCCFKDTDIRESGLEWPYRHRLTNRCQYSLKSFYVLSPRINFCVISGHDVFFTIKKNHVHTNPLGTKHADHVTIREHANESERGEYFFAIRLFHSHLLPI